MPLLNGLDAAGQIIRENERIGIIILSMYADESYIVRALDAGARGYLLKDNADDDIERAIRSVAIGRPFFSPSIAQALLEDYVRLMRERRVQDSYEFSPSGNAKSCNSSPKASRTRRLQRSCL